MVNNKGKRLYSIFLSFLCLTLSIFLLNATPLGAKLPPLDSGNLPFVPPSGPSAPPGSGFFPGGFFPQFGAPYGLPYQDPGLGFMPPPGQYGLPGQYGFPSQAPGFGNMFPNFMPPAAPYGFPTQARGFNYSPTFPNAPINPYLQVSSDTSNTNSDLPPYDLVYTPNTFPNQSFYGPMPNMLAPTMPTQQFPGASPFAPRSAQGFINPYVNPNPNVNPFAAPYGNMAPFSGPFQGQGFPGYPGLPNTGYNPFQPMYPWQQQPWSPYGTNINPPNPYQYNPSDYYPSGGNNNDDGDDGGDDTVKIPKAKGHWAGTWEAWLTDPNEGLVTDPNGQIIITMSGEILFNITDQDEKKGGAVTGTIEITGWDVDPAPQDWPGDWTGESDQVILSGWIDQATRYLKARYFYYPGKEDLADYDMNIHPENIVGLYTWFFNTNKLVITANGISGQFSITGTKGYYVIGVFSTAKFDPQ